MPEVSLCRGPVPSVLALLLLLALLLGCMPPRAAAKDAHAIAPHLLKPEQQRARMLQGVKSWGYQLKRLQVDEVAASPFDLVVVDYAPDRIAGVESPFRPEQVAAMKARPNGARRIVLAYLSIGEAEWYRTYWKGEWQRDPKAPWLGAMNPRWFGNFPVRYWHPEWQAIVFGKPEAYLDRILAAGFDGVYLDRADVYQDWEKTEPNAERLMADFVVRLAAHARKLRPDALVVMQNAEELLARRDVRKAIDGIAKEDLFYGINHDEAENPADGVDWSLDLLRKARRAQKRVLVVEYVADPRKAAEARKRSVREGFLPYLATRDLGHLVLVPPDLAPPPQPALSPSTPGTAPAAPLPPQPCGQPAGAQAAGTNAGANGCR